MVVETLSTLASLVDLAKNTAEALAWARGQAQDRTPTGQYVDAVARVVAERATVFERRTGQTLTFDPDRFREQLRGDGIDLWQCTVFAPLLDALLGERVGRLLLHPDVLTGAEVPAQLDLGWARDVLVEAHQIYMRAIWSALPERAQQMALSDLARTGHDTRAAVAQVLERLDQWQTSSLQRDERLLTVLEGLQDGMGRLDARLRGSREPVGFAWRRPVPPAPLAAYIDRCEAAPGDANARSYRERLRAALTTGSRRAALFGGPGLGKSTLARQTALDLEPAFAGGVLFEELTPQTTVADTQPILLRWAELAGPLPEGRALQADEVRARLSGHGPILVVLDNVWDLPAARFLIDRVLPPEASVLIATQRRDVALALTLLPTRALEVGPLERAEAEALVADRLGPSAPAEILRRLTTILADHPLALDVAARDLALREPDGWNSALDGLEARVRSGQGLGPAALPGEDDAAEVVRASLAVSAEALRDEAGQRFRSLGALVVEGPFAASSAALVWHCSPQQAADQLLALSHRGLVHRTEPGVWRQHRIVRAYARMLLQEAGDLDHVTDVWAAAYCKRLWSLAEDPQPQTLAAEIPQVDAAFDWWLARDPEVACNWLRAALPLAAEWGLAESLWAWVTRLLATLDETDSSGEGWLTVGQVGAMVARHTVLERESRLRDSLQALDAALERFTRTARFRDVARVQYYRGELLFECAQGGLGDPRANLLAALAAYADAQSGLTPETDPSWQGPLRVARGHALAELAELGGEDRAIRLVEALAAFESALARTTPAQAPDDYADAQFGRGKVLYQLTLEESAQRAERLRMAFDAFTESLAYSSAERAPHLYAMKQAALASVLSELATLPDVAAQETLQHAATLLDEALKRVPVVAAPLDHAMLQGNRGSICSELAELAEDGQPWLDQALSAYDAALTIYAPDRLPMAYAHIQRGRAAVLRQLSEYEGEDEAARLREARHGYAEALRFVTPASAPRGYAKSQYNVALILRRLAELAETDAETRNLTRLALGQLEEAGRFFSADVDPDMFAHIQRQRGDLLVALAHTSEPHRRALLQEADAVYREALHHDLTPLDTSQLYLALGEVCDERAGYHGEESRRLWCEADEAFERAVALVGTLDQPVLLSGALILQGRGLHAAGRYADAESTYTRAVALLNRPPAYAYVDRARAFLALDNRAAARHDLEQARSMDPEEPEILCGLGEVARRDGRANEAQAFFESAIAVDPDISCAHLGLGHLALARGQMAAAKKAYRTGLQGAKRPGEILALISSVRQLQSKSQGADGVHRLLRQLEAVWRRKSNH